MEVKVTVLFQECEKNYFLDRIEDILDLKILVKERTDGESLTLEELKRIAEGDFELVGPTGTSLSSSACCLDDGGRCALLERLESSVAKTQKGERIMLVHFLSYGLSQKEPVESLAGSLLRPTILEDCGKHQEDDSNNKNDGNELLQQDHIATTSSCSTSLELKGPCSFVDDSVRMVALKAFNDLFLMGSIYENSSIFGGCSAVVASNSITASTVNKESEPNGQFGSMSVDDKLRYLTIACLLGRANIVRSLLKAYGHELKPLLQCSVDIVPPAISESTDGGGAALLSFSCTPLHAAASCSSAEGSVECVRVLLASCPYCSHQRDIKSLAMATTPPRKEGEHQHSPLRPTDAQRAALAQKQTGTPVKKTPTKATATTLTTQQKPQPVSQTKSRSQTQTKAQTKTPVAQQLVTLKPPTDADTNASTSTTGTEKVSPTRNEEEPLCIALIFDRNGRTAFHAAQTTGHDGSCALLQVHVNNMTKATPLPLPPAPPPPPALALPPSSSVLPPPAPPIPPMGETPVTGTTGASSPNRVGTSSSRVGTVIDTSTSTRVGTVIGTSPSSSSLLFPPPPPPSSQQQQ